MNEEEVGKCPKCNGEMEKGYIITDMMRWSRERREFFAFGAELIVYSPWKLANLEAYRCDKCRATLFFLEKNERETPKSFLKKCVRCGREIPLASEECQHCGARQEGVKL